MYIIALLARNTASPQYLSINQLTCPCVKPENIIYYEKEVKLLLCWYH